MKLERMPDWESEHIGGSPASRIATGPAWFFTQKLLKIK